MNCYSCKCKCVPLSEYDGMFPSDVRCPQCGRVFDGDGDLIERMDQESERMNCPNCGEEMTWCEQRYPDYDTFWKCMTCGLIKEVE